MSRFHAEWAWLGERPAPDVLIEVDGGRFTTVTPHAPRPPDARHLPGLTLPGFANAHSHAFHRALRGRTHGGAGDFWSWRERMYAVAASSAYPAPPTRGPAVRRPERDGRRAG